MRITLAALRESTTSAGGSAFGTTSRSSTRTGPAPRERAASMNSRCLRESTSARTTLAIHGHEVNPRSRITRSRPGPKRATTTTARKNRGTTCTNSVMRMSASSVPLPCHAAMEPTATPMLPLSRLTMSARKRDVRAPYTTPEKTSRPRSSVPIGCSSVGGRKGGATDAKGWAGAIHPARSAVANNTKVSTTPIQPASVRSIRGDPIRRSEPLSTRAGISVLLISNSGIEPRIGKIGDEVGQHHCQRDPEKHPEQNRVVSREQRREEQTPQSRPGEHHLDEHGTRQEHARPAPDDRDHWQHHVPERMANDGSLGQTLCPRGPHVVGVEGLEQTRPHKPRRKRKLAHRQDRGRQSEVVQDVEQVREAYPLIAGVRHALNGKESGTHGQDDQGDLPQPEGRSRIAEESRRIDGHVCRAPAM